MTCLPRNQILVGDVRQQLGEISDASIDCVITSPPYFQLRDYGIDGQIGLEANVEEWVDELRLVLNGLIRVLKPTGSLWLNLGDTYSRHARFGSPAKGLMLAPERLLLALADEGWIVRNKVIWAKTNPMPHCVGDRLTNSYDVVYFLTRSSHYFFDLDAIRIPHRSLPSGQARRRYPPEHASAPLWRQRGGGNRGLTQPRLKGRHKNPGDVWPISTGSFRGAHFATFPPALVERPLLATCPEKICRRCGQPYRREATVARLERQGRRKLQHPPHVLAYPRNYLTSRIVSAAKPVCDCRAGSRAGVVLDPFFGAGTVGLVAEQHRRDWVGIELNPAYAALARRRISDARPPDGPAAGGTASAVAPAEQPSNPGRGTEP